MYFRKVWEENMESEYYFTSSVLKVHGKSLERLLLVKQLGNALDSKEAIF